MDSVTNFFWNDTYNAGTPTRSTLKGKKVQNGIDGKSQAKKRAYLVVLELVILRVVVCHLPVDSQLVVAVFPRHQTSKR